MRYRAALHPDAKEFYHLALTSSPPEFATFARFQTSCLNLHIAYRRYLAFDTIGTVVYTTLWVVVGAFLGERAVAFLTTDSRRWLFLGGAVTAGATLLGYRIWRRFRYGGAQVSEVEKASEAWGVGERGRA